MIESNLERALGQDFIEELRAAGERLRAADLEFLQRLVVKAVRAYVELKTEPSRARVSSELRAIEALTLEALRLGQRKTPRPGEYLKIMDGISARLAELSEPAKEMLIETPVDPSTITDPIEQYASLLTLYGATGRRGRSQGPGKLVYFAERYLHSMLSVAFNQATAMPAHAKCTEFAYLCEAVKRRCKLKHFNWESMDRATRKGRASDEFLDLADDDSSWV
jgi:hypothetical protein